MENDSRLRFLFHHRLSQTDVSLGWHITCCCCSSSFHHLLTAFLIINEYCFYFCKRKQLLLKLRGVYRPTQLCFISTSLIPRCSAQTYQLYLCRIGPVNITILFLSFRNRHWHSLSYTVSQWGTRKGEEEGRNSCSKTEEVSGLCHFTEPLTCHHGCFHSLFTLNGFPPT